MEINLWVHRLLLLFTPFWRGLFFKNSCRLVEGSVNSGVLVIRIFRVDLFNCASISHHSSHSVSLSIVCILCKFILVQIIHFLHLKYRNGEGKCLTWTLHDLPLGCRLTPRHVGQRTPSGSTGSLTVGGSGLVSTFSFFPPYSTEYLQVNITFSLLPSLFYLSFYSSLLVSITHMYVFGHMPILCCMMLCVRLEA
jgi:hypothetical protein